MNIKIPTLADTIVSNKGRCHGAGVLLRCPVCALPTVRLRCTPTAATRSGRFICHRQRSPRSPDSHLRFESDRYKNKSHSECIIHYGIYWYILRYWMQRNADEHPQILLKSCFLGMLFSCAVILKYAFCYPMIDFGGKVNGIRKEYSVAV